VIAFWGKGHGRQSLAAGCAHMAAMSEDNFSEKMKQSTFVAAVGMDALTSKVVLGRQLAGAIVHMNQFHKPQTLTPTSSQFWEIIAFLLGSSSGTTSSRRLCLITAQLCPTLLCSCRTSLSLSLSLSLHTHTHTHTYTHTVFKTSASISAFPVE
jgi:hypothetical protein